MRRASKTILKKLEKQHNEKKEITNLNHINPSASASQGKI